ncbi:MAG: HNH endonuclease [Mycoplasmataceae bacterium]|nr:HNH endonuclease [Mycoplasmataceae bacterium]
MNSIDDKINFILSKFNDPKEFAKYGINKNYKAKLWNMDTSILGILEQMKLNVDVISSPIYKIEVRHMGFNKNKNTLFSLFIDGINITPSKIKKEVSCGAIRQYLQVLSSLGIVMFGNTQGSQIVGYYKVSANFKSTINDYNNSEMIKRLIIFCLKRNIDYSRNLSFSIFIFALNFYKYDFTKVYINNRRIEKPKNKDGIKFFDITGEYRVEYLSKCWYTYKSLVEFTLKHESIEKFINDLIDILEDKNESDDFSSEILLQNYLSTLNKERSKFKDSIKANRETLNLYNKHENIYSDIISIDNSVDGLACKFNELNAAHIYNIWQIKNHLKQAFETEKKDSSQINEIIGYAKNPYNGLMMSGQYHDYFDRNLFTFNIDGQMIYREADKDYLFHTLKMKEVKINPKILNEEMKNFLSIRKF